MQKRTTLGIMAGFAALLAASPTINAHVQDVQIQPRQIPPARPKITKGETIKSMVRRGTRVKPLSHTLNQRQRRKRERQTGIRR